ncbi:MAG: acetate--CoA ligase family protein, partial [Terriglobia bacterium]
GPNCNGMVNFVDAFALTSTASIQGKRQPSGDVAVVSQSGGAGQVNVMWRAQQAGLGISYQVSCGNDADLSLVDYMSFMVESERTKVVLAIAERMPDGEKLRALAKRAAELDKPIVMVKVGRTEAGSRAAASHTGSVTGADEVSDAALRQLGIIRVDDCNELYEAAMLLRRGRRPKGNAAAALSVSGGNLVMMADLGASHGIEFPSFSEETKKSLGAYLPGFVGAANPTDLTSAAIGKTDTFAQVAKIMAGDPGIDTVIPVLTHSAAAEIRSIAQASADSPKPTAILWTGKCNDDPALTPEVLVREGHAVYRDALPCIKAVSAAVRYSRFSPSTPKRPAGTDPDAARKLLKTGTMTEKESKAVLACYGLPVTQEFLARNADEAAKAKGRMALKISSPDIPHKTEANAIRLNVSGESNLRAAYLEILENCKQYRPDARIEGVLVQEMVEGGEEILLGLSRDPAFGPVLTVGLGGIFVEIFKDVTFRLPPIGTSEAEEMLKELRSYPLLAGARGRPPLDIAALADCIERLSWLAVDLKDRIVELDINPLRVLPKGAKVVDALVVAS